MSKRTFDEDMQGLLPEFQERFYKEQRERWLEVEFTSDAINEHFHKYRAFALMFETPIGLNVSAEYFVKLMTYEVWELYNVADIITLMRAFENRTFFEFMQSTGGMKDNSYQLYADFLSCMEQITNEVNAVAEPIKDSLVRKMQAYQRVQLSNGNKKLHVA